MKVKELEGGEDSKANMKRAWAKNMSCHLYRVLVLRSSGVFSTNLNFCRVVHPYLAMDEHGKKRSIAGMAQHSTPIFTKESPFWKKFPLIWLFSIFTKNSTHLQFYKRNKRKNYSEQKKINFEIWSQKYPLEPSSWRPFLKKVAVPLWFWKLLGQLPNLSKI